jgi:hypothetical protein
MTQDFYDRLGIHSVGAMSTALSASERRVEQQLESLERRIRAEVAPFADMSPDAQKERHARSIADPDAFARAYMPHYCTAPPDPFHRDLDAIAMGYAPPGHPDGEAYVWPIHGPREHAKSVRIGRVGLLRRLLVGDVRYPIAISEHLYISQAHVDFLLVDLTANVRVAADYGVDVILRDRSNGTMRVAVTPRATGKRHDFQIDAASYGRPVKGRLYLQHRPDWVLIDDFESTRTARNREISKEKADWILQEVYPGCTGPIIWLGNVGHDTSALFHGICESQGGKDEGKDLMRTGSRPGAVAHAAGLIGEAEMGRPSPPPKAGASESPSEGRSRSDDYSDGSDALHPLRTPSDAFAGEWEREDEGDLYASGPDQPADLDDAPVEAARTALVYRAERIVLGASGTLETEYLWPSRYLPSWYERRKKTMGPFKYEGEYNGFPSREGDVFKREWLEAALYDEAQLAAAVAAPGWRMFSWFDPAFGKSGTACDKAIVACGSSGTDVFVCDAYVRNDESTLMALHSWHAMFERWERRGLLHGQYENDFGQEDRLMPDIDQFEEDEGHLNASGDSNRRGSKDARIESMQPLASTRRLRFPRAMSGDMEKLFNQLLAYPSGNDDGPDALESCVTRLRRGVAGDLEYTSLGKRRHSRTGRRSRRR